MIVKVTWNPSERQLRQFGFCALVALPLLGWLMLGRAAPATWTTSQAGVFALFVAVGLLGGASWFHPRTLKLAFLIASLATIPIGIVVGELVCLILYFAIFTPVALLFRIIGRDALQRQWDPQAPSYWMPRTQTANVQQYFRQS